MSTTRKPSSKDQYFYGFRYVKRDGLDGKTHTVIEPLTKEDVLHPREGDFITQGDPHDIDRTYLRDVATTRAARLPQTLVLSDCLIDMGVEGIKSIASDLAVFTNVPRRKLWSSFSVRKEKAEWVLVGEITSPSTRDNDLNVKPAYYWRAGVPLYFIVDQESTRGGVRQLRIVGYERGRRGWRTMRLSAAGRLWLEPLQLWLGAEGGRLVCYDAEGREIEDYTGVEEARQHAEAARQDAEAARADAESRATLAEDRARQLEEELRRLREGG